MKTYYIEYTVRFETEDWDADWIDAESEAAARQQLEDKVVKQYGKNCEVIVDSVEEEKVEDEDDEDPQD